MSVAAYQKKVNVSTDKATWKTVPCTSPSLDFSSDVLDDTTIIGNKGYHSRILGLHDWSISCDSNYSSNDDALKMIRAAKLNRTVLYVQYIPTGNNADGYQGEVVVENFNLSGEVSGLETVSITLQGNGALSDIA